MALVTIVTRDVADRFHGFLASTMLEVAPNIFCAPRLNPGVRERIWSVLSDWHRQDARGSVVMICRDLNATGGMSLSYLGIPPRELIELDGMWITRRRRQAREAP